MSDSIFALATSPGRGALAVLRISGPAAGGALLRLGGAALPEPRRAVLRRLRDPASGDLLDRALVLWCPGPASFTGEDVAELHLHGGRAVVGAVLEALGALPGLRPADAGEFTRRAFLNHRMDLTEAEAVADLIDADTAAQRRQALRQMGGELGTLYDGWRRDLVHALAYLEADLDFPDEDLPGGLDGAVRARVAALRAALADHLADNRRGERLRDGVQVALLGAPNVGKSSLLNLLARRDAAIVSPTAGTTRDVIEVALDLGGYPVVLADTAGVRETRDSIEAEGVRRARARADAADLRVVLFDAGALPALDADSLALAGDGAMIVLNKADLTADRTAPPPLPAGALWVSLTRGDGIEALLVALTARVADLVGDAGETPSLTRTRHRSALETCRQALDRALTAPEAELAAEDLRLAARALGRITGRVDVEDILDAIFRDFCIGK